MNRGQSNRPSSYILKLKLPILQLGLLFLSLFCFPYSGYSQDYTLNLQAFDVEDGLLHRNVTCVFEDKDGMIWIGSAKGLQRFDGHDFKSWTMQTTPRGKISHITAIGQDQEGWLWLWNNHLLEFVFLQTQTEEVLSQQEKFGSDFPIKRIINEEISGWGGNGSQLKTDSKGRLYFVMRNPVVLFVYDSRKGFSKYPLPELKNNFVSLSYIDRQDELYVREGFNTNSTIYKIDTIGNFISKIELEPNMDDTVSQFSKLNEDLYFHVRKSKNYFIYKLDQSGNRSLIKKKERKPKSPFYMGRFTWDYDKGRLLVYVKDDFSKPIFNLDLVDIPKQFLNNTSEPFEDSKGRYWFPSNWGLGLAVIKPNRFKKYFSFEKEADKPINNSARGILVENDTLYSNFEFGGLVSIPLKTPDQWDIIYRPKKTHSYLGRPIAKASSGGFYIGNAASDIFHFNQSSNFNIHYTFLENKELGPRSAWSFYNDRNQKLWVGFSTGIAYKNSNENYLKYVSRPDSSMKVEMTYHICPDKNGKLWLASKKGLYLFDPEAKSFLEKYGNLESGNFHLPAETFYYLHIDSEGIFWLGADRGLIRWDRKTNEKRLFTTIDGFSNDVIYAIFEDDYNKLWLSSDYGIMQFDKETFHVKAYLSKDGIAHEEFNKISAFQEKNGTIYFGGLNGITAFHPKDFLQVEEEELTPMIISSFEIFDGKSTQLLNKVGEIRKTNTVNFYPDDRFFRLSFSLPIFENAKKFNYAWQVEGVDKDWNYQKENSIQIGKLPYGTHTLKIKGQLDNGKWSPAELAIKVNVIKPFYLQFWFIVLSLLALLMGGLALFNWRTKRLQHQQIVLEKEINKATTKIGKQAEELKKLDKVKSRFFANVSHELRTPLTLMLGPISSILKNNKLEDKDYTHLKKAQQNGKELLKLVGSILDLSKLESGKLELQEKPELLFPLIRRLASSFESHAEREGIRFSFVYKAEKDLQLQLDKGKLEIIINNLLSNALKFSQSGGQVSISVEDLGNAIKITVEDKGRGIHEKDLPHVFDRFYQSGQADAPTEGGTGIGLALSQELVNVMKGKIWVESEWKAGSSFFIELPRKEILGMAILKEEEEAEEFISPIIAPKEVVQHKKDVHEQATILIVEDNHSLRTYLKTILKPYYNIWTAENGLSALDVLQENKDSLPSLVLSDIMMPEMDGFQLLEVLKSRAYFRHLPVIMLTARADIQDKIKALRIGVDDYLLKPFEEDELLARVDNVLNNYNERLNNQSIYAEQESSAQSKPSQDQTPDKAIPILTVEDSKWLEELETHLKQHLSNNRYSISQLAFDLAISERQLRRKIKTMIGLSPSQYLKEVRLQAARELLEQRKFNTVAQTAGAVGFQDPGAFSRNFSNRFGKMPSEYLLD